MMREKEEGKGRRREGKGEEGRACIGLSKSGGFSWPRDYSCIYEY